jgi:hypothetical protein
MRKSIALLAMILAIAGLCFGQSGSDMGLKSRVGFIVGPGFGFSKIPIAELTNGDVTSINFGGGTVVKFEYGRRLAEHWDLSVNAGGQFSRLDRYVSNGNMSFNRSNLSLTPAYILPLGGDEKAHLRIGLGLDFLYNAQLNFDLSAVPGGANDDWNYGSTIGEHISLILELNPHAKWSFVLGLKAHTARFKFESGTNSFPLDSDLKNPAAGGMDLLAGACFHFGKAR